MAKEQALSTKLPPQNVQAEAGLLGSVLLDPDSVVKIAEALRPDDFYERRHGMIFRHMLELYEKRRPIDVLTVAENTGVQHYFVEQEPPLKSPLDSAASSYKYLRELQL